MPKAPTEEVRAQILQLQKERNINVIAADHLEQLCQKTNRSVLLVCDGRFANKTFLRDHPDKVTVIARVRKDTALFYPPSKKARTGRKRFYGEDAPTPEEHRQNDKIPWQKVKAFTAGRNHYFKVKTLAPVVCPLTGGQPAQVIVIAPLRYRLRKNSPLLYRQPAYLLCTDPNLPVQQVLQSYLWRWDIETNFRDEKTLLGVGQAQVRTERSCQLVPAAAVAAYSLLLLAGLKVYPPDVSPDLIPRPRWRKAMPQRPSTATLISHLRYELFAQALKPDCFRHFWSQNSSNQKPTKLDCDLASSLFYAKN